MGNNKKLKVTIMIIVIFTIGIGIYMMYMKVTAHDRYINREINKIKEQISDYRNGHGSIRFYLSSNMLEDERVVSFLREQTQELCDANEYNVLRSYLNELEVDKYFDYEIQNIIIQNFEGKDSLDEALAMKNDLGDYLKFYNSGLVLNRDSGLIKAYIEKNGMNDISTTPGTGYYAKEEDRSTNHRVGLDTSPLYDAERITHIGDFKIKEKYGVELDSYYQEKHYSYTDYYFRDCHISFSPYDGECIYSGKYLFCFSKNGNMVDYCEIDVK